MGQGEWSGKMGPVTKDIGIMVMLMDSVPLLMQLGIFMKGISICRWLMETESTLILRDRLIGDSGNLINKMDKEKNLGVMAPLTKVHTQWE